MNPTPGRRSSADVPMALRRWFVVHFVADMLAALPLFIAPTWTLTKLGWTAVDPVSTRLVAAALFGIGIESLLGRDADRESYTAMLNLKVIWSAVAVVGLAWSIVQGAHERPLAVWGALVIFASFHLLWVYWRIRLRP